MTLEELNRLPRNEALEAFARCCGTRRWGEQMADARPFRSLGDLFGIADRIWSGLSPEDWREAFRHHPRIGGVEELRKKFASTADWASGEQSGVEGASEEVLNALAEGNARYERRYGHIFLVCATGKSATEMLAILESRMNHSPEEELRIAAAEQAKITRIRLEKTIA